MDRKTIPGYSRWFLAVSRFGSSVILEGQTQTTIFWIRVLDLYQELDHGELTSAAQSHLQGRASASGASGAFGASGASATGGPALWSLCLSGEWGVRSRWWFPLLFWAKHDTFRCSGNMWAEIETIGDNWNFRWF
jgi:hypothetical protein